MRGNIPGRRGKGIVDEETALPSVQYIYVVADISDECPTLSQSPEEYRRGCRMRKDPETLSGDLRFPRSRDTEKSPPWSVFDGESNEVNEWWPNV